MFAARLNEFVVITVLVCALVFVLAVILMLVAVAYSRWQSRKDAANRERYLDLLLSASEGALDQPPSRRKSRLEPSDLAVHLLSNTIGEEREQLAGWLLRGGFDSDAERWMSSGSPAQRLRGAVLLLLATGEPAVPTALTIAA